MNLKCGGVVCDEEVYDVHVHNDEKIHLINWCDVCNNETL
jgi:hypothetical protein